MSDGFDKEHTVDKRKINKISTDIYKDLIGRKNSIYTSLIIIFSIVVIIVAYMWINTHEKSVNIADIFNGANLKYFALMFICVGVILLINAFSKFIGLYGMNKQKKFGAIFNSEIKSIFYNKLTTYTKGWIVGGNYLVNRGIALDNSIDIELVDRMSEKVAKLLYSFIILASCGVFCFKRLNVVIFILGVVAFLISVSLIVFVILFNKKQSKMLEVIASFSGLLYKCRLVKDYEMYYNLLVGKLYAMSRFFKQKSLISLFQILFHIIINVLKVLIIYLFLLSINISGIDVFAELLLNMLMIDLIVGVLPLPSCLIVCELLFYLLFASMLPSGYIFWALLIYRFFDFYIYIIVYLLTLIADKAVLIVKNKGC